MTRAGIAAAALTLVLAAPAAAAPPGVVVAFRADAPPFSAADGDGDGFAGYLADLCEAAVARAGYAIDERRAVTAETRFGPAVAATAALVCDPTTITEARAARFDFSPMVFIANASFLERRRPQALTEAEIARSEDCAARRRAAPDQRLVGAGMVSDTTASAAFLQARREGTLADTPDHAVCALPFETHEEGVDAVCSGPLGFYFGDVDILRAQLARHKDCAARFHPSFLTYEPYAIAIPSEDPEFRRRFVAALYGLFADGSALGFYRAAFGPSAMSDALAMLFRINAIPAGDAASD